MTIELRMSIELQITIYMTVVNSSSIMSAVACFLTQKQQQNVLIEEILRIYFQNIYGIFFSKTQTNFF